MPKFDCSILWSEPQLGIDWPIKDVSFVSKKDKVGINFIDAEIFWEMKFFYTKF